MLVSSKTLQFKQKPHKVFVFTVIAVYSVTGVYSSCLCVSRCPVCVSF